MEQLLKLKDRVENIDKMYNPNDKMSRRRRKRAIKDQPPLVIRDLAHVYCEVARREQEQEIPTV